MPAKGGLRIAHFNISQASQSARRGERERVRSAPAAKVRARAAPDRALAQNPGHQSWHFFAIALRAGVNRPTLVARSWRMARRAGPGIFAVRVRARVSSGLHGRLPLSKTKAIADGRPILPTIGEIAGEPAATARFALLHACWGRHGRRIRSSAHRKLRMAPRSSPRVPAAATGVADITLISRLGRHTLPRSKALPRAECRFCLVRSKVF